MNIYLIVTLVGEYCSWRRAIRETWLFWSYCQGFSFSRFLSTLTGGGGGHAGLRGLGLKRVCLWSHLPWTIPTLVTRIVVYKIVKDYHCPRQLQGYFAYALRSELRRKALRDSGELHLPRYKTAMGQSTFEYAAAKEWNDLPKELHMLVKRWECLKLKLLNF